jgi:hypothetical protein
MAWLALVPFAAEDDDVIKQKNVRQGRSRQSSGSDLDDKPENE